MKAREWHMTRGASVNVESRLAALETRFDGLDAEIHGVKSTVDRIAERVGASQRTNWAQFIGVGALVLTMLGLWLGAYTRDISRLEEGNRENKLGIERAIEQMDIRLQREMRDRDEIVTAQVRRVEDVLQARLDALRGR